MPVLNYVTRRRRLVAMLLRLLPEEYIVHFSAAVRKIGNRIDNAAMLAVAMLYPL